MNRQVLRSFFALCAGLSLNLSAQSFAQDDAPEIHSVTTQPITTGAVSESALGVEDDLFHPGGSCAALAYLNPNHLAELIKSGFSDDRHSFCYPEEPSDCSEYTGLLQGRGRLTTGEDGFHCNLQVNT